MTHKRAQIFTLITHFGPMIRLEHNFLTRNLFTIKSIKRFLIMHWMVRIVVYYRLGQQRYTLFQIKVWQDLFDVWKRQSLRDDRYDLRGSVQQDIEQSKSQQEVLRLVISSLAEKSKANGSTSKIVPFRESALTRILYNALEGNSKTFMICTISPEQEYYEETLATLKFAEQAKKIKNNIINNQSTLKFAEQAKKIKNNIINNQSGLIDQLQSEALQFQDVFLRTKKFLSEEDDIVQQLQDIEAGQQFRHANSSLDDKKLQNEQLLKQNQDKEEDQI